MDTVVKLICIICLILVLSTTVESEVCYKKFYHKKLDNNLLCRLPLVNKHRQLIQMKNGMKCCKRGAEGYYSHLAPIGRHHKKFICLSCEDLLNKRQKKNNRSDWSEWSDWSNCTCGDKSRNKTRVCLTTSCDGKSVESKPCRIPECADTEWNSWSECTVTCGTGIQSRTRVCENLSCPGNTTQTEEDERECLTSECPIDGGWSDWKISELCSTTCGRGIRTLIRKCNKPKPRHGGEICNGTAIKHENCSVDEKCPMHGEWSFWTRWSGCLLGDGIVCGHGIQNRTRTCDAPKPKHGGNNCIGSNIEEKTCYYKSCDDDSIEGSGIDTT